MKRALVLAGGGLAGIAWETGVLLGIADENPELADTLLGSDVVLGTSAGSAVAAQIGSGRPLSELFARQISADSAEIDPGVPVEDIAALFLTAMTGPGSRAEKLRRVGAVARDTKTVPEATRRAVVAARLPSHSWPDRDLRITAIDADTGEFVVFTDASGVDLVDAVAASCAVPGAWPVVHIGGRRFIDGGVGSIVNMDAVADCGPAVVLVPSPRNEASPFGTGAAAEIDAFPGSALAVFADDAAREAFGTNALDPACRPPAAEAGRRQGRREAAAIAQFLAG